MTGSRIACFEGPEQVLQCMFNPAFSVTSVEETKQGLYVHSVQQKSIGQKFSKSRTGCDVRYSCHYNLSRFTFPILAYSWRFSVFHSLQSITHRIYEPKTTVHLLNLKLKHYLNFINFPRLEASQLAVLLGMEEATGPLRSYSKKA